MTTTNTNTHSCTGKTTREEETVTVVTASTMQYLTQHPEQKGTQKGYFCFVCLSVVNSCRETPGPIPNPEAKPAHADGTATGRLWESKSPPTPNNKNNSIFKGKRTEHHRPLPFFHVLWKPSLRDDAWSHSFIALRRRYAARACLGE